MLGVFLDIETNGLNPRRHNVLELAYKIVDLKTGRALVAFASVILQPETVWKESDPASLKINGFTWEEVARGEPVDRVAEQVQRQFRQNGIQRGKAVFICQNPSFDRAFFGQIVDPDLQESLLWPYHWLDLASMYWKEAMRRGSRDQSCFPWCTGFSKDRIATVEGLPKERSPHRAMNGVDHLLLCYEKVVGFPQENQL